MYDQLSVVVGSAPYSIRSCPDPCVGGLTHLTILFSEYLDFRGVSQCCAWSQRVARCLTMRCLDNCSSGSFCCVLVPDTTKSSPVSEHRRVNCARMVQTRRKLARVISHRCHGILTRNVEARVASYLRSINGFAQKCVHPLVHSSSSLWHLDQTCRAVEMRCTDVIESQNFLSSRCSPLASRASTEHDLESFQSERSCKTCCSRPLASTRSLSWFPAQPALLG